MRELESQVKAQGWVMLLTAVALFTLTVTLTRKGVISWKDLANA